MLVRNHSELDFEMLYFNADGREGSMCGNGGRCIAAFARELGITGTESRFMAVDGPHRARIADGEVSLEMKADCRVEEYEVDSLLAPGSPHFIRIINTLTNLDVIWEGRDIRSN